MSRDMPEPRQVHLAYLEGIRGWAAVFVALHHVWQFVVMRPDLGDVPRWFTLMAVFKFGGYAVPVFIVLSGYCLMLPVARVGDAVLPGGLRTFAERRARRILIPYYAALALALLLIVCHPRLGQPSYSQWDTALPALTVESVLSHVLLVHNWFPHLQWTIDPPMWSVAIEWQIYFLFALVLLPVWRRFGPGFSLAAAFALGFLPMLFGYRFVSPWYLGLFACGMLAAAINFMPGVSYGPRRPASWEKIAGVCAVAVGALTVLNTKYEFYMGPHPGVDMLVGFGTAAFLVACTRRLQLGLRATRLSRILEHRVSTRLGEFSYSIYLVHYPIVAVFYMPLLEARVAPVPQFAILVFGAVPAALVIAYAFHRVFERPFMRRVTVRSEGSPSSIPAPPATPEQLNSAVG
jgi:peptidoglycan/LPS O-acetylase OafA/YrhL